MELCQNGELFDIIAKTGPLSENCARSLFHQLVSGLEECHRQGIIHNDLKCENILFDSYTLKISDFGSSLIAQDLNSSIKTRPKNQNYMAPELHCYQNFNGESTDIFAAGVILFVMVNNNPPFHRAILTDPNYKSLSNRDQKFWNNLKRRFSEEFKDFIENLLAVDPSSRLNFQSLKLHP